MLENREGGTMLKQQAVLFRASHHSGPLEVELTRRNIPFVKFGGLKFLDAAHIKDMLALLRLTPGNKGVWPEVRTRSNRLLGGWSAYFSYGALASAYEAVGQHVYDRTRNFLRKRHKVQGRGTDQFSSEHVYGELAVRCLRRERGRSSPSLTMKPVGKPDAGKWRRALPRLYKSRVGSGTIS